MTTTSSVEDRFLQNQEREQALRNLLKTRPSESRDVSASPLLRTIAVCAVLALRVLEVTTEQYVTKTPLTDILRYILGSSVYLVPGMSHPCLLLVGRVCVSMSLFRPSTARDRRFEVRSCLFQSLLFLFCVPSLSLRSLPHFPPPSLSYPTMECSWCSVDSDLCRSCYVTVVA